MIWTFTQLLIDNQQDVLWSRFVAIVMKNLVPECNQIWFLSLLSMLSSSTTKEHQFHTSYSKILLNGLRHTKYQKKDNEIKVSVNADHKKWIK